jgi:hypothetical protein
VLSVWPESTKLPGGTAVVQLQAECGFKASAAWRFKARALESPQPGLARRIRGDMAHEALRLFWTQVPDQATLLAMSVEQCERHVSRVVDAARRAQKPALPNSRLVALECAWLSRVLMRGLDKERTRSAFSIVECEQSHEVVVAGCTLTVRIDRVDRLEDGSTVILDYKTGQRDARQWVGTRPNPAQLPFYAAHRQPPPDAVALALVAHANKSFSGLAARNDLLPGIVGLAELRRNSAFAGQAWSTVISEWRAATIGLVRAFVSGESLVDPARAACDRCDLAGLCRIPFKHDLNSVDVSDEDSSEEQMETAS